MERSRLLELVRSGEGGGLTPLEQEGARAAMRLLRESGFLEESLLEFTRRAVRVLARRGARLTPEEVRRVMAACPADCVAAFALLTWAGIRPEELKRLRWRDVRLDEGFVQVPTEKAKTAQARNVEVLPALRAWLVRTGRHAPDAPVCPPDWLRKSQRVRAACGVEWVQQDMLRHSFGSYHLAQFRDEGRTKTAMGHSRNSETLFVHYRAAATLAAAEEFWKIGL